MSSKVIWTRPFALWWRRWWENIWSCGVIYKETRKVPAGSHYALSQNHHCQGKAWVQGHQGANTLVLPLVLMLTRAFPTWIRWDRNWPKRVCIREPRVPTILHIPGVQDVVKREKTIPHNWIGHAKFLNFDLCRFRKLAEAKEMQTECSQPIMFKCRRRGHLVLLDPQDLPMRWIFQPVMCTIFPTSSHTYWCYRHHLLPGPTPTGRLHWLPCVSASASPVQPTATQQYLPEILSLWQRRSQHWGSYLFTCWFTPSQGRGSS